MCAESLQLCPTLCIPMDCSPPGSSVFCPPGFSRQEYWSELPCLPPGVLPNPGTEPAFPAALAFQADSLLLSHWGSPCMCLPALFVPGELYVKYLYVLLLYDPLSWKSMWLCLQFLIDGTLLRTFWEFLCWVIILSWLNKFCFSFLTWLLIEFFDFFFCTVSRISEYSPEDTWGLPWTSAWY